ncbi:MAG: class I SAM-dependent RNA methyltransferase [Pseudomonadota bacterium]
METQIEISRMGLEGQGVGYDSDGNIYFVPGALVGDKVRVKTREEKKKYRDAEIIEVVEPSGKRIDSVCQYFQKCGGCDWLQWDYQAQLSAKEEIVKHILERGELRPVELLPITKAEQNLFYRNRIQVRQQGQTVGFFKKKTHELVDITECKVAAPEINDEIKKIRSEIPADSSEVTKIELYLGKDRKVHRFDNVAHSFSGFAQIHSGQNDVLKNRVAQIIKEKRARKVLELYCGDGNLTYAYLPFVEKVWGIDASKSAIDSARIQRTEEHGSKAVFFTEKVDFHLLRRLPQEIRDYDTLVLDPPRQGMLECLPRFLHNQLKNIIYISCSPVTFTQDVQCLKKEFILQTVEPIDMFPQTKHVELIATWVRR